MIFLADLHADRALLRRTVEVDYVHLEGVVELDAEAVLIIIIIIII